MEADDEKYIIDKLDTMSYLLGGDVEYVYASIQQTLAALEPRRNRELTRDGVDALFPLAITVADRLQDVRSALTMLNQAME